MTQSQLNRAVAAVTGETVREIRRRGFGASDADVLTFAVDADDSQPATIDWDAIDARRPGLFPARGGDNRIS